MKLPSLTTHHLHTLKDQELYDTLKTLHLCEWSIRSLSQALEVSPTTMQKYLAKGVAQEHLLATLPGPPRILREEINIDDAERLQALAPIARRTGTKGKASTARQKSEEFNRLLRVLSDEGFSLRQLSNAAGITRTAISLRLKKTQPREVSRSDLD